METLQNLLTIAAEGTVIVGIAGIFAHALYTQHQSFMATYCPAVKLYQPEVQAQEEPTVVEAVEVEQPAEQPEIQAEEIETAVAPAATEIDLTALDPTTLRKLCTKHQIAWKHARGKNRHATKSMMIHQLSSRLTA